MQIDHTRNRWRVRIGGHERQSNTVTSEQSPNERVAWNSVAGDVEHAGVVTFHRLSDETMTITVQLEWAPPRQRRRRLTPKRGTTARRRHADRVRDIRSRDDDPVEALGGPNQPKPAETIEPNGTSKENLSGWREFTSAGLVSLIPARVLGIPVALVGSAILAARAQLQRRGMSKGAERTTTKRSLLGARPTPVRLVARHKSDGGNPRNRYRVSARRH